MPEERPWRRRARVKDGHEMVFRKASWPRPLRSQEWFGGTGKNAIMHRSWMKNQGLPADTFDGRPIIGICNTWSELTPATRTCARSPSG